jgi:hypothetical protein
MVLKGKIVVQLLCKAWKAPNNYDQIYCVYCNHLGCAGEMSKQIIKHYF